MGSEDPGGKPMVSDGSLEGGSAATVATGSAPDLKFECEAVDWGGAATAFDSGVSVDLDSAAAALSSEGFHGWDGSSAAAASDSTKDRKPNLDSGRGKKLLETTKKVQSESTSSSDGGSLAHAPSGKVRIEIPQLKAH